MLTPSVARQRSAPSLVICGDGYHNVTLLRDAEEPTCESHAGGLPTVGARESSPSQARRCGPANAPGSDRNTMCEAVRYSLEKETVGDQVVDDLRVLAGVGAE